MVNSAHTSHARTLPVAQAHVPISWISSELIFSIHFLLNKSESHTHIHYSLNCSQPDSCIKKLAKLNISTMHCAFTSSSMTTKVNSNFTKICHFSWNDSMHSISKANLANSDSNKPEFQSNKNAEISPEQIRTHHWFVVRASKSGRLNWIFFCDFFLFYFSCESKNST